MDTSITEGGLQDGGVADPSVDDSYDPDHGTIVELIVRERRLSDNEGEDIEREESFEVHAQTLNWMGC